MTKRTSQIDQWQDPTARAVPASRLHLVLEDDGVWALADGDVAPDGYLVFDAANHLAADDLAASGLRIARVGPHYLAY